MYLTREQRKSLKKLWERGKQMDTPMDQTTTYLKWRRKAQRLPFEQEAIVVPWAQMAIVIEGDGYTHS